MDKARTGRAGIAGTGADEAPGPRFPSTPPRDLWRLPSGVMELSRPRVMGILNITPDSFSDGGELTNLDAALRRAEEMILGGAAILDVGGESTRPGSGRVQVGEECERVVPFIEAATRRFVVPISVDTRKAAVARAALEAGAEIVNDVSGFAHDSDMPEVVKEHGAAAVLMHMRGDPDTMMEHAHYGDLLEEIGEELRASVTIARSAGIPSESLVLDPGIGFAKDPGQSLLLLKELDRLLEIGFPLLVGPSRKSFIGAILDVGPKERLAGTVAACVLAYQRGARIFRVHDVQPVAQALKVAEAIETSRESRGSEAHQNVAGGAASDQDVPGDGENTSNLEGSGGAA